METRTRKMLWYAVFGTLAVKAAFAALVPITSDEAYFTIWAKNPDFGYYDHPPMIGWILHLLMYLGRSELIMRLPAILFPIAIGIGIYLMLRGQDEERAALAATLFLVSPINVLDIFVTTDTPLYLFAFLSVFFLYRAVSTGGRAMYLLSGVFLGMAFLSKYFAALLGLSYLVYLIVSKKDRTKTLGFAALFAAVVPFVLVNLYWNYTHCWVNILFNLFNRNRKEEFSLLKPLLFLAIQAYLATPPLLYFLYRSRKGLLGRTTAGGQALFAAAFAVPLAVLGLLSFKKTVGLHWALAFYPFLYLAAFFILDARGLYRCIRYMLLFTLLHLVLAGALLAVPVHYAKGSRYYSVLVMGTKPREIISHLTPYMGRFHFATTNYAKSALLGYHSGMYFSVFGPGSFHGRQDDIITDYRDLADKDILIFTTARPDEGQFSPFFDKVETEWFAVEGADFFLVKGSRFRYDVYREKVLKEVRQAYYNMPRFLPCPSGSCYFYDRYFPSEGGAK